MAFWLRQLRRHDEQEAERLIEQGLKVFEVRRADLEGLPKGYAQKTAVAAVIRKRTVMTNGWIARKLHMGDPSCVCRYCSVADRRPEIRKLVTKLEKSIGKA